MKILGMFAAALAMCVPASAQSAPQVIRLWDKAAPGFENRKNELEQAKDYWVRNVDDPSITVFPPPKEKATGAAVVIAPGGGFRELVFNAEGKHAFNMGDRSKLATVNNLAATDGRLDEGQRVSHGVRRDTS
jgi:hypothetical protein